MLLTYSLVSVFLHSGSLAEDTVQNDHHDNEVNAKFAVDYWNRSVLFVFFQMFLNILHMSLVLFIYSSDRYLIHNLKFQVLWKSVKLFWRWNISNYKPDMHSHWEKKRASVLVKQSCECKFSFGRMLVKFVDSHHMKLYVHSFIRHSINSRIQYRTCLGFI